MNGQSVLKTFCLTQREYTHGIVRYIICTLLSITLTQGMLTIVRKCVKTCFWNALVELQSARAIGTWPTPSYGRKMRSYDINALIAELGTLGLGISVIRRILGRLACTYKHIETTDFNRGIAIKSVQDTRLLGNTDRIVN